MPQKSEHLRGMLGIHLMKNTARQTLTRASPTVESNFARSPEDSTYNMKSNGIMFDRDFILKTNFPWNAHFVFYIVLNVKSRSKLIFKTTSNGIMFDRDFILKRDAKKKWASQGNLCACPLPLPLLALPLPLHCLFFLLSLFLILLLSLFLLFFLFPSSSSSSLHHLLLPFIIFFFSPPSLPAML